MDTQKTVYREDYKPYPYNVQNVSLYFDLDPDSTTVINSMQIKLKDDITNVIPLELNGVGLDLKSVKINHIETDQYTYADDLLIITPPSREFSVEITSHCHPKTNSSLMGLYISGDSFFTQCEAEGFRKITFFPDRPDVMTEFRVTIDAPVDKYPFTLSNGNLIESIDLPEGKHRVIWHDPFLKPCYLFALVGGKFDLLEERIKTKSGREVLLQIYSDIGSKKNTEWAMESLINAIRWDEERFGLELDLSRFMIVAARDFNMGAMENKGLNIFNAMYVLASPETATDANYQGIEGVIGHEYFHNWTGNRVTCRDWFQLSLKEGLTVFRDQEFSADMMAKGLSETEASSARAVNRIQDVINLRAMQFPEDEGPMAHPIRPQSYQEIANFYTATVYEKGAEVIRMQHTLLGEEDFQAGMREYFARHDGNAVTCDDFVSAMESIYSLKNPGRNLNIFRRWYSQAGTPTVNVEIDYSPETKSCQVKLSQSCPNVGVEKLNPNFKKLPFHIPFKISFINEFGIPIKVEPVNLNYSTSLIEYEPHSYILDLHDEVQTWSFINVTSKPIPSLLRDFSAPVKVKYNYTKDELITLATKDANPFVRWESTQTLAINEILSLATQPEKEVDDDVIRVWQLNISDTDLSDAYKSLLLQIPGLKLLSQMQSPINPQKLVKASKKFFKELAVKLESLFFALYSKLNENTTYILDAKNYGIRSLKNTCLNYLLCLDSNKYLHLADNQYLNSNNMTDRYAALSGLVKFHPEHELTKSFLNHFYHQFEDDQLVIDKWFALQATHATSMDAINKLISHPQFNLSNPNRARSLIFQFSMNNMELFHSEDGLGYEFFTKYLLEIDSKNPEVAARYARIMDNWSKYDEPNRTFMKSQLDKISAEGKLSPNVREIISKASSIN
ncbi:aminopeptidase N [Taylorella equigenitalis 14/56]|uniref:Aminopeptidase N n=1 Tax=Taylorella equigenitalis 14/56 TaxID=1091497 RepID=I7IAN3_9BURK|nr:aminopeptidase N [Taylorella equigenitalis]WDU52334.1 aminopeptidase N [Taylorella equigenitalis]WDU53839.1 aminopeptidase N [Taylorella equigenitalis]WDU55334.1 aminopeptidase N [Taylorella equigenitalis]CCG17337.1 aminopeptidase N [Taylorella equigenitalis 14/56]